MPPPQSRPHTFDRLDMVARAYKQYANSILSDLQSNSEDVFGCPGRIRNGSCRFGYDKEQNVPETRIDEFPNNVV